MGKTRELIEQLIKEDERLVLLFDEDKSPHEVAYQIVMADRPPNDDGWYVRWRLPSVQTYFEDVFEQARWCSNNLTNDNIGRTIVWIGSCPSGPTVADYVKWDGSEKAIAEIARCIIRHSGSHAWRAYPAWEDKERDTIWHAEMRTMDLN